VSPRLQALLWDVDGTLAETERDGHRVAFNRAFEALGLPWRWDVARYGELLAVAGGLERLLADLPTHADAPAGAAGREALARELHALKNGFHAEIARSGVLTLRPGVRALIDAATAGGLHQAIATTSSRGNVEALLETALGPGWARHFGAVVCNEDVQRKKPDPEAFVRALRALGVAPRAALALEDSPAGVAAALAAGVPVVVTRSFYFPQAEVAAAVAVGPGLHLRQGWRPAPAAGDGPIGLDDLRAWHALG
jgi:HAD superfamily hydrolase (TIGR01509 family)